MKYQRIATPGGSPPGTDRYLWKPSNRHKLRGQLPYGRFALVQIESIYGCMINVSQAATGMTDEDIWTTEVNDQALKSLNAVMEWFDKDVYAPEMGKNLTSKVVKDRHHKMFYVPSSDQVDGGMRKMSDEHVYNHPALRNIMFPSIQLVLSKGKVTKDEVLQLVTDCDAQYSESVFQVLAHNRAGNIVSPVEVESISSSQAKELAEIYKIPKNLLRKF